MINYYSKFIPNLATTLHPLHVLLRDGVKLHWSEECAKSFTVVKNHLIQAPVLVHNDPNCLLDWQVMLQITASKQFYLMWTLMAKSTL